MKKLRLNLLRSSLLVLIVLFNINNGSAQRHRHERFCLDSIPGITVDQKVKIEALRDKHMKAMDSLIDQREKTQTWDEKDKLDRQILEAKISHRKELYTILNDDQQKYFEAHKPNFGFKHRGEKMKKPCPPQPPMD